MTTPPAPGLGRVWTIPNILSMLRLAGVPLFCWLALGPKADGWAVIVLMVAGFTDYADGKIARTFNLMSRLGELLDPAADRLYILATLAVLTDRSIIPLWLTLILAGREVALAIALVVLNRAGIGPPAVTFLGKAAALNLMYAFPLLLLSVGSTTLDHVVRPLAWGFAGWGAALYVWTGALYLVYERRLLVAARAVDGVTPASRPSATA
ncbi:MAG TPA: CDP-alcohol phosphatidyltransferase family protein [Mycobacteriales bacterium]|nr:CDP-alcohol phosphatidyltransferase family protein [Mycobacteriales bacterium]